MLSSPSYPSPIRPFPSSRCPPPGPQPSFLTFLPSLFLPPDAHPAPRPPFLACTWRRMKHVTPDCRSWHSGSGRARAACMSSCTRTPQPSLREWNRSGISAMNRPSRLLCCPAVQIIPPSSTFPHLKVFLLLLLLLVGSAFLCFQ